MTTRVDGQEAIHGQQYHKLVTTFFGVPGLDQRIVFVRWTPTGTYAIDGDHRDSAEYLDAPFPVSIGSAWTMRRHPTVRTPIRFWGLKRSRHRTRPLRIA